MIVYNSYIMEESMGIMNSNDHFSNDHLTDSQIPDYGFNVVM